MIIDRTTPDFRRGNLPVPPDPLHRSAGADGRLRRRKASMIIDRTAPVFAGGTSRFPQTPSTGPRARTGGFAAGKRA